MLAQQHEWAWPHQVSSYRTRHRYMYFMHATLVRGERKGMWLINGKISGFPDEPVDVACRHTNYKEVTLCILLYLYKVQTCTWEFTPMWKGSLSRTQWVARESYISVHNIETFLCTEFIEYQSVVICAWQSMDELWQTKNHITTKLPMLQRYRAVDNPSPCKQFCRLQ